MITLAFIIKCVHIGVNKEGTETQIVAFFMVSPPTMPKQGIKSYWQITSEYYRSESIVFCLGSSHFSLILRLSFLHQQSTSGFVNDVSFCLLLETATPPAITISVCQSRRLCLLCLSSGRQSHEQLFTGQRWGGGRKTQRKQHKTD